MNISSHAIVALRITKGILPLHKRLLVMFGSIWPDLNYKTQPHRENNLLVGIFNSQNKIKNTNSESRKSFELGVLMHYICDYFCYAHKYNLAISHGIKHMKYEIEMDYKLRKNKSDRLKRHYKRENLMQFILDVKEYYNTRPIDVTRDIKYIMSVCEESVCHMIGLFKPAKKTKHVYARMLLLNAVTRIG